MTSADLEILADLLSLVVPYTPDAIADHIGGRWTLAECSVAETWAAREHLHASDNPVKRLPRPDCVSDMMTALEGGNA